MRIRQDVINIKNAKCERCGRPADYMLIGIDYGILNNMMGTVFCCAGCLDVFKKTAIKDW